MVAKLVRWMYVLVLYEYVCGQSLYCRNLLSAAFCAICVNVSQSITFLRTCQVTCGNVTIVHTYMVLRYVGVRSKHTLI